MFRRWLLTLTLLFGLLAAPVAMAEERAQPADAAVMTSHCAEQRNDPRDHAPAKQFRCMGACLGVEPALAAPLAAPAPVRVHVAIAGAAALTGRAPAQDPPPPRPA